MVVLLALVAALANAVASICQRLGVEDAPVTPGVSVSLVRHMIRRPIWLGGFAVMGLGFAAQAVALHLGSLDVVQPLLVSELVMLVVILWLWYSTPLRPRDLAASVATAVGLGGFLAVAAPHGGGAAPSDPRWAVVAGAVLLSATVMAVAGSRGASWWRALARGAAASLGFALVAALTKSLTDRVLHGWAPLFTSWQLYALCVVGLASFLVMQSAFQVGPFTASQSSLILLNPLASLLIGWTLFNERLHSGAGRTVVEVLFVALMVLGAVGLSSSPLVASVHDDSPDRHRLRGRGRLARSPHSTLYD